MGVKTGGKAKFGVKTGGKAKFGLKTGGSAKAGGSFKFGGGLKGKAGAKGGLKVKIGLSGKAHLVKTAKPLPSAWNVGTTCRTNFVGAFNAAQKAASMRKDANAQAKKGLVSLFKIKAAMVCSSCDPSLESKIASNFGLQNDAVLQSFMTSCAAYLNAFSGYKKMVVALLNYAKVVDTKNTAVTSALTELTTAGNTEANWVSDCLTSSASSSTKTAPTKSTTKPTGQFLPPLKSSTKTAPAAKKTETKKRILQAVVVTVKVNNDSWNWWVKNSKVTSTERFTASDKCLASAGIQGLLNNWVFKNRNASFNAFNVMYKSLNTAFKVLGNAKATYKWTKFVGQKLLRKQKGKIATKLTVKTSIKAKKSTKAKTGAFLPKLKVSVKSSGKTSKKASGKISKKASGKVSVKTTGKAKTSGSAKAKGSAKLG